MNPGLRCLDELDPRPAVKRLPDAQVEIKLEARLHNVVLMGKLHVECLRVDLHDGALASFEKVTQVVDELGVAEPQSHPQSALPYVPVAAVAFLSHCDR